MGASDSGIRIPVGIHKFPSLPVPVPGYSASQGRRKTIGSHRGDPTTPTEERHREGSTNTSLLPIQFLSHNKEIRRLETHSQPSGSQQTHKTPTVQDGIPGSSTSRTPDRLVGGYPRLKGCLPTHRHRSFRQEVAGFLHRRADLQIQEPTFRSFDSTQDIHQSGQGGSRIPPKKGDIRVHLPRRLAPDRPISKSLEREHPSHQTPYPVVRLHSQRREVSTGSVSTPTVPRLPARLQGGQSFPYARKGPSSHRMRQDHSTRTSPNSPSVDAPPGANSKLYSNPSSVPSSNASNSAARSFQVQEPQGTPDPENSSIKQGQEGRILVDAAVQHSVGQAIHHAPYIICLDHGRLQDRMGRPLEEHSSFGHLVPISGQAPHQSTGVVGHPPGSTPTSQASLRPIHLSEVRQHVSSDVHQQDGRSAEPIPVSPVGQPPSLVQPPQNFHPSGSPPRSRQHTGRLPIKERDDHQGSSQDSRIVSGMASEQDSLSHPVQQSGAAPDRSLCEQSEQPASNLLQLGKGSDGLRPGCDVNQLGQDSGFCLPTDRSHPSDPGETRQVQGLPPDPHSTQVAPPNVVPEAPDDDSRRSDSPSSSEGPHPNGGDSSPSSDSGDAEPDSMATFIRSYTKAGLSKEAATIAGEARRSATRRTYNTRLRKYFRWCKQRKVNPYSASIGEVGDFLTSVFKDEEASVNSVRSCRTAIGAVHHGFPGGTTVSNSSAIHDLIKGMFNKRPPQKSLVPAWDLPRAIRLLAEPPFEPLDQASLLDLSRKTAFLVAAACGRRVSEIHALSTAEKHLEFRAMAVHLLPRAGFLAKNQTIDFTPKHIVLPDLRHASKSPDSGPWCPVRALRYYLHRTKPYRGNMDNLFLTTSKPVRVASKQTISRWIISVIKDSLLQEEISLAGSHVRAHDLRSQAAAWALYRGSSIQDVMEAQGWSSSSTFQSVYLKDILISRAESATRVLTTARTSSSSSTAKVRD